MGSSSSKFKKYLQHGDEYAAMQVYQSSSELRKALRPSFSYGDHHHHNTPLHYAARHGMKHLIRTFINDLDGNPNKRNALGQTALHSVCNVRHQKSPSNLERRAYSVMLLLSWRGSVQHHGERERADVNAKDRFGNTPLHYAAQSGLRKCIEYLIAHGADFYLDNADGLTACDVAMREGHHHVAQFLELKMVFSSTPEELASSAEASGGETSGVRASSLEDEDDRDEDEDKEEVYCGLRSQDLQEAKDQLLLETADMLHVPIFTAEALLRHSEWSRENLLEHWIRDPVATCRAAGVQPPQTMLLPSEKAHLILLKRQEYDLRTSLLMSKKLTPKIHSENSFIVDEELAEDGFLCELCCDLMTTPNPMEGDLSCGHKFCTRCWKEYLQTKIKEGDAHQIRCPAFECDTLVPIPVIERHVSPQMARKYLKFDLNEFIETNKSMRWCPYSGCQRVVNMPESNQGTQPGLVSHAVDCGEGHFFCWECGGDAHAPVACPLWQQWVSKCSRINPSELEYCLWLITNTKPCPNCQSAIQKTDGCNHMRCAKCKHDFCWLCLEAWKKHSSSTGGFFRCNRFSAAEATMSNKQRMEHLHCMSDKARKLREINRFIHYYARFRNHENSRRMEEPLSQASKRKREMLQASLASGDWSSTKFYIDGVRELIKARQILCGSYAYGYFLATDGLGLALGGEGLVRTSPQGKSMFEYLQSELEEATERLCEVIARPYLRTPRKNIIDIISHCRRKRQDLLRACYLGLVPPETTAKHVVRANVYEASKMDVDRERLLESISDNVVGRRAYEPVGPRRNSEHPQSNWSKVAQGFHQGDFRSLRSDRKEKQRAQRPTTSSSRDEISLDLDQEEPVVVACRPSRSDDNLLLVQEENPKPPVRNSKPQRLTSKSISTDGAEGRALPEVNPEAMEKLSSKLRQVELANANSCEADQSVQASGGVADDGCFRIGELHQSNPFKDNTDDTNALLKRSQSTGDMEDHLGSDPEPPAIGADHKCERPEDYCRRSATKTTLVIQEDTSDSNSTSTDHKPEATEAKQQQQQPQQQHHSHEATAPAKRNRPRFVRQKSFEIDSDSTDTSIIEQAIKKSASLSAKASDEAKTTTPNQPKQQVSKKSRPALTIKIENSSFIEDERSDVDLDSVLTRSPTLHISGVSISRSPFESPPKSASSLAPECYNRNRSSSLIVPGASTQATTTMNLPGAAAPPRSPGTKSLHLSRTSSPAFTREVHQLQQQPQFTFPATSSVSGSGSGGGSSAVEVVAAASAASTASPLSSILHIQDSYLSSDDFHEALFFEKSPKALKRRRRSKKAETGLASASSMRLLPGS